MSQLDLFANLAPPQPPEPTCHIEQERLQQEAKAPFGTLVVVGCSNTKGPSEIEARDLYVSPLFRYARAYAETRPYPWVILSAAHGLVEPDVKVEPYNTKLDDLNQGDLDGLQDEIDAQLQMHWPNVDNLIVLAGKRYADMLSVCVRDVDEPLEGLQIGERQAFLKEELRYTRDHSPHLWAQLSDTMIEWLAGKLDGPVMRKTDPPVPVLEDVQVDPDFGVPMDTDPCDRCGEAVDSLLVTEGQPALCFFCHALDKKAFKAKTHRAGTMDGNSLCGRGKAIAPHPGVDEVNVVGVGHALAAFAGDAVVA